MGGNEDGGCDRSVVLRTGPPGGSDVGGLEGVCAVGGLPSVLPEDSTSPRSCNILLSLHGIQLYSAYLNRPTRAYDVVWIQRPGQQGYCF